MTLKNKLSYREPLSYKGEATKQSGTKKKKQNPEEP